MFYCSHCMLANETDCCRVCGEARLPEAHYGDFCYLTTQKYPWAAMLQDVLKSNRIACTQRPVPGAWKTAYMGDSSSVATDFFVPYEKLAAAQLLVEELFDAEPMEEPWDGEETENTEE